MRCFRLMIGLVCLAGLVGCEELDSTLGVRNAVGGAAPWAAVTAYFNADWDKAEYGAQLSAHHRDGHDGGGGRHCDEPGPGGGTGGPPGRACPSP